MEPALNKIGITPKLEGSVALLVRGNFDFFYKLALQQVGPLVQICGFIDLTCVIVSRDFLSCFMKIKENNLE